MLKHTKIYMNHFNYSEGDFIPCEVCGREAVDVNHLEPRGMGGSKEKDYISNLVGMCREHHMDFEAKKINKEELQTIHNRFLRRSAIWQPV